MCGSEIGNEVEGIKGTRNKVRNEEGVYKNKEAWRTRWQQGHDEGWLPNIAMDGTGKTA